MAGSVHNFKFSWFDWFCLWYPPGWLILFNRHWQKYHPDPDGWNWLEYGLFLIPCGFYLALLLRWLRLGFRSPRSEIGEFAPNYQQAFRDEVLTPIVKYYFRADIVGIENLPQTGPLIVAMNHAGMCFPWDFLGLGYLLSQARGWVVQPLAHVSLFNHPWLSWWLPPGWSKVLGGVPAQADSFEEAIAQQTILLYAPEGLRGPAKGWRKRYKLETFHPSFIRLSDRYHIPILPVVCIGNESLHSWAFNFKSGARRIKLPFLPISLLMIAFVFFPSMGVWAMKTPLHYEVQPVYQPWLKTDSAISEQAVQQASLNTEASAIYQQAQSLRAKLQIKINQLSSFTDNSSTNQKL
ncbi:MAG TPA: 1-acyl-sn-glycerol-3-phosphate acyltransferase [Candidatus Sericytochromatia bacterium]